jgi:CheY-like chemotaxis protein
MQAAGLWASPTRAADEEPARVLLVDDDLDILEGLAELLADEGYDVATATDGQSALNQLRTGRHPCAILLDLMMPGMNGWDFRAEQMADDDLKDIPVVVITAGAMTDSSLKAQLGDIEILRKPPRHDLLMNAVRRACGEPIH